MDAFNHNFFLLRRPLLSLETIFDFNCQLQNGDEHLFEERILELYADGLLQESIFLASSELHGALLGLLDKTFQGNKKKLLQTLYKYLIRMSTRSTPFGFFAGTVTGETATSTKITFKESGKIDTAITLDVAVSAVLAKHMSEKPYISSQLLFYPNTSLHFTANRYHYIKRVDPITGGFNLIKIHANHYLDLVLENAQDGVKSGDMAQILKKYRVNEPEAQEFVRSLIDEQILVSELEISVFGQTPIQFLINQLKQLSNTAADIRCLETFGELLEAPIVVNEKSNRIQQALCELNLAKTQKNYLKADMRFNEQICTLDQKVIDVIQSDFTNLLPLRASQQSNDLLNFAKQFFNRYQHQQMPLLEVIDHQTGVGYSGQVPISCDDIDLMIDRVATAVMHQKTTCWSKMDQLRLRLYEQALKADHKQVEISDSDLAEFSDGELIEESRAEGFYIMGTFLAENSELLDAGHFKFSLDAAAGPSAFNLMSRFCIENHVLEGLVSQCVGWEEFCDPESVFAEINHLPDCRTGNILSRPGLRKYEIPYLSGSQSKRENQILPSDLIVSVTTDFKIALFSKRLKKRVYPRLTSAHLYTHTLPVYRFLADLARSEPNPAINWNWDYLAQRPFLPRITYKHLILSKATWNVRRSDLCDSQANPSIEQWQILSKKLYIPRYVQLVESDRLLLIDGQSKISTNLIFEALKKSDTIRIIEYMERPGEGIIADQGEHYSHQVIIPFLSKTSQPAEPVWSMNTEKIWGNRHFPPGSNWLYVKIYCHTATADQILTSVVKPITDRLMYENTIEKWFFIRYQDPEPHLRLRFYLSDVKKSALQILDLLNQGIIPFKTSGMVHKMQLDTYERELERYHPIKYNLAESIFCSESTAVLEFLTKILDADRWKIAILGIEILLDDLRFTVSQKTSFVSRMQISYFKEMNGDQTLLIQLNHKFRQRRAEIETTMNRKQFLHLATRKMLEPGTKLIRKRRSWKKVSSQLQIEHLASSFIHMFLNRLFASNHRQQELLIYHYLKKFYELKHAREQKTE